MGWQIPALLSYKKIKRPSIVFGVIALIVLIAVAFTLTVFLFTNEDTSLFWFYAIVLPLLIWLVGFSCRLSKYIYSLGYNEELKKQNQHTTQTWQHWSKKQIPVYGSYFISAEDDGIKALTGDVSKIPLFPEKARPLFNPLSSTKPFWFLDDVMSNLEKQAPNYRKYLTHIYLPDELMADNQLIDAIFSHWNLKPEPIDDYDALMTMLYDDGDTLALSLLLVCQYSDKAYRQHSKFISAMLIGDNSYHQQLPIKSWLGRLMMSDEVDLSADIEQLFSYNQQVPEKVKAIWLSGLDKKNGLALAMQRHKLGIAIETDGDNNVVHDIDLTFAKPTNLSQYLLLTMANCYANEQFTLQLAVSQSKQQLCLQLISPTQLV
ncbi:hypothetical protein RHO14_03100 [Orbus wheelerorum]|uniref:hypothetical protein n=1 Tax=Orbus wheelerorum TaxID=3074111 RepID=UPI00370DAF99